MATGLTKPLNPQELWEALVRWIKPGERELPEGFTPTQAATGDG